MSSTLYRRPLPTDAIEFSSTAGRQLFAEALASGGLDGYFRIAEQFHTQAEPEFCGLGSLVVALNALGIDPGRLWKGPWRWFSEELLDCCVSLEEVRQRGLDLDEVACLARCNGAAVELYRPESSDIAAWRSSLAGAAHGDGVVIAAYDRAALDQTGSGHFSPIGGYYAAKDMVLVLDVARFKYPPHWISAERLWQAMHPIDPATGRSRGWIALRRRAQGVSLSFTLSCEGEDLKGFARRLSAIVEDLGPQAARCRDCEPARSNCSAADVQRSAAARGLTSATTRSTCAACRAPGASARSRATNLATSIGIPRADSPRLMAGTAVVRSPVPVQSRSSSAVPACTKTTAKLIPAACRKIFVAVTQPPDLHELVTQWSRRFRRELPRDSGKAADVAVCDRPVAA